MIFDWECRQNEWRIARWKMTLARHTGGQQRLPGLQPGSVRCERPLGVAGVLHARRWDFCWFGPTLRLTLGLFSHAVLQMSRGCRVAWSASTSATHYVTRASISTDCCVETQYFLNEIMDFEWIVGWTWSIYIGASRPVWTATHGQCWERSTAAISIWTRCQRTRWKREHTITLWRWRPSHSTQHTALSTQHTAALPTRITTCLDQGCVRPKRET